MSREKRQPEFEQIELEMPEFELEMPEFELEMPEFKPYPGFEIPEYNNPLNDTER